MFLAQTLKEVKERLNTVGYDHKEWRTRQIRDFTLLSYEEFYALARGNVFQKQNNHYVLTPREFDRFLDLAIRYSKHLDAEF